jgi:sRNA-binding carbon storage regulator CsrA
VSDSPKRPPRGHLVVTRYVGESIVIGNEIGSEIEVRLDDIEARRARLIVVAPLDITVRRGEPNEPKKRGKR